MESATLEAWPNRWSLTRPFLFLLDIPMPLAIAPVTTPSALPSSTEKPMGWSMLEPLRFTLTGDGWVRDGAPPWMHADVAWVMAHDVVHHRPSDVGRYADEVASVGAQWFIDHPVPDADTVASMASTMHSVMLMGYEAWGDRGLRLVPPPDTVRAVAGTAVNTVEVPNDALVQAMRVAAQRAWVETREYWSPHGFERSMLTWLDGPEHVEQWVAHLLDGWSDVQRRWGSRANARRAFGTIHNALEHERRLGAHVMLTLRPDGSLGLDGVQVSDPPTQALTTVRRAPSRP